MHLSPWLTTLALFTTSAHAFYPYSRDKSESTSTKAVRRFFPWARPDQADEDFKAPTLDIHKRPSMVKRENIFPIVTANVPTLKNTLAINEDHSDYSYFGTLNFGSNGTPMWMLMDSGAANTWVMGTSCTSAPCAIHNTFGPPNSTSLNVSTTQWSVSYGTGSVSGVSASDKVSFAGFNVELGFGLASTTSNDFSTYPFDGILGLGRPDSDSIGTPTIMQVLDSQNLLKSNIIGVHLQRYEDNTTDGQITFGSVDPSKFIGSISYTSTTSGNGLWQIPADGCSLDGKSCGLTNRTAIIDTGTSYILMPPNDATAVHKLFPRYTQNGESYLIPCDSTEKLQFTFSGVTYNVSPKDYVGSASGDLCNSNIVGHQAFNSTNWLLGDVFLKNVYTVFDFDQDRVGFAVNAPVATQTATASTSSASAKSNAATSSSTSTSSSTTTSSGTNSASSSSTSAASQGTGNASPFNNTEDSAASALLGSPLLLGILGTLVSSLLYV